jgi:dienelactone hydrolase
LKRLAALGFVLMAATANAQMPRVDSAAFASTPMALSSGVRGTIVKMPTRNPEDFGPAIHGDLGTSVALTAQLFSPSRVGKRLPAVIIAPGSGGIGPHHLEQALALVTSGFAVLVIDPFHARGIGDTIADQSRLTWAASAYDVLAALTYLRARADIDPDRIGAVGSSRGGTAVMMAIAAPFSDAIVGRGRGLRAVVAGYPWCGTQFRSARLAKGAALLVLQGDRDDWVSVQQCQDAVHALSVAGGNAMMKIFAGGLHALDRTGVPPTRIESAVTSTIYPTVYMDDDGRYFDLRSGDVDPSLKAGDFVGHSVAGGFLHKGVTVGTSGTQAAEYAEELVAFLKKELN